MKVVICNLAMGGWYPRGTARLIQEFERVSPGYEIQAHVNTLPFGAPANVIENGYDYTAYCAKPFAMMAARNSGADIAIWIDCAFYPIRSIHSLVDHIAQTGYYLCDNGYKVGEWCSDRAMERMGQTREKLLEMREASSYCVGLNFADGRCVELLHRWCGFAGDRLTVPAPHTQFGEQGRNIGHVSHYPGVRGHRHEQTVLSVLANQMGMTNFIERPRFTTYEGHETDQTVLLNRGV